MVLDVNEAIQARAAVCAKFGACEKDPYLGELMKLKDYVDRAQRAFGLSVTRVSSTSPGRRRRRSKMGRSRAPRRSRRASRKTRNW